MSDQDMFDEFDDLLEDNSTTQQTSTSSTVQKELSEKYGFGGYENMSNDDIKKFKTSKEFTQFSAEIDNDSIKTNYAGKSIQEILGLSNLKESSKLSFNAIEHYDVDIDIYQDIVDSSLAMQETLSKGESILPSFKYLHQDIFLSLYKYKAKLLPESDMHMSTKINRSFAQSYLNTPEYITLRQNCRLDQFNAALGTEIIGNKLLKIIKEVMQQVNEYKEQIKKMKELQEAEEQMDSLLEEQETLDRLLEDMKNDENNQGLDSSQLQDQIAANQAQQNQLKELANKLENEIDTLVNQDSLGKEISYKTGTAFSETSMEVAKTSKYINAWGLGEGETCKVSFQNKKDAIEKIRHSDKLKKMTDMIGRFKESAITEQKKKIKNGATEIHSVKIGKDIQDTLPSERMNLCNDVTKKDFYNRYSEGKLLTYAKESNKSKNKGPIIVCCDTSGSMSDTKEMWSKAFAIGILEIAQLQKRDYACIIYSSKAHNPIIISKDEIAPEKVICIAEDYDGCGTNFEAPLRKATELIKTSQFKDADIVFITDGDCRVSEKFAKDFKKVKEDKEFKTQGILIDIDRFSVSEVSLREFCDDITRISSVADLKDSDSDVAKHIFSSL